MPKKLLLSKKLIVRRCKDIINRDIFHLANKKDKNLQFVHFIEIIQPIKNSAFFENKIHNIQTGINEIQSLIIFPGEIFSFWNTVKQPSKKKGYKVGRNLISGILTEDYGGGLCQLSSIIYHISLIGRLNIKERHNHSLDIYREEDRFTPLGSDATVVYGYKDLRIENNLPYAVKFSFKIENNNLHCFLWSEKEISPTNVDFERIRNGNKIKVLTKNKETEKETILVISHYIRTVD